MFHSNVWVCCVWWPGRLCVGCVGCIWIVPASIACFLLFQRVSCSLALALLALTLIFFSVHLHLPVFSCLQTLPSVLVAWMYVRVRVCVALSLTPPTLFHWMISRDSLKSDLLLIAFVFFTLQSLLPRVALSFSLLPLLSWCSHSGTPQTMTSLTDYGGNVVGEVSESLAACSRKADAAGVPRQVEKRKRWRHGGKRISSSCVF